MEVQSHWYPIWGISCQQCSAQLVARVIANGNGKQVRAELQCPYCDGIELQEWIVQPYQDGLYLLDLEPVDLSTVG